MSSPLMFVFGCSMVGFVLPEIWAACGNAKVPVLQNIWCAIAAAFIAASFAF